MIAPPPPANGRAAKSSAHGVSAELVKVRAIGQWGRILQRLGVPAESLDPSHEHPCPKCGGDTRFRAFDDFETTGGVRCNQCHAEKCSDGIAAVQWLLGVKFTAALDFLVVELGLNRATTSAESKSGSIVATYDYRNAAGELEFQAVRLEPKDFRQRRPKDGGGWDWSVKGCPVLPYRLPELLKAEPAAVVFIVEGEKDVDNLQAVGLVGTCNAGGAGKWKAAHAKHLAGRHVVGLADNDDPGRKHAAKVAKSLHGKAASVKILELPDLPAKGDVSDWLAAGGTVEQLLALAEAAPEWSPDTATADSDAEEDKGFAHLIADMITADDHFAVDAGGKGHRYADGAYRPGAEAFIRARVKRLCIAMEQTKLWSRKLAEEVVAFILVDAEALWERPPLDVVNVANGLLHLAKRVLLPHTPKHLTTVQLPVTYDPKALCPGIDQFAADVFPGDASVLAYEVPAWLMTPDVSIQKAVLLLGAGGNGKSTWLTLLVSFLGRPNCVGLSLHSIEGNRFASARLVGKLANICPDLPTEHLAGTSVFKSLTGTDVALEAEQKFRDGFSHDPFCRLVFSANSAPRSSDASDGFFDRWVVVPFDARFRGTDRELTRRELDARLSAPAELSGLLNKAVDAWHAIRQRGGRLSEPESVQAAWREFHASTDPLSVWLDQFTVDDPDSVVARQTIRAAYGAACERTGRPSPTEKAFGLAMAKLRPHVTVANRTVNGRRQWSYVGIGLRDGREESVHGVQGVQDTPPIYLTQVREGEGHKSNAEVGRNIRGANPEHPEQAERGVNGRSAAPVTHNGREVTEIW